MKGTEYFVSLQTGVVLPEELTVVVNIEELIRTTISDVMYKMSHKPMLL